MAHQPLDDLELDTLEAFLESDQVHEECQNFVMAHGFLTALSICPASIADEQWLPVIFEDTPTFVSQKEEKQILQLLARLFVDIKKELESEDGFLMPCELEMSHTPEELSELQEWATGFMEGVFMTESHWFESEKEEVIAELLLPIMVASDLFDDEEVVQIRSNEKLTHSCIAQIPEVLTDLFLVLRTEPEKRPMPHKNNTSKKSHGKKGGNKKR
ncbi:YecA/YgfB family protein [Marinomonas transparens]|uniref:YecA family protein n=1 Tax=Marinomonas transparens TaxID=2795388 RepID=A0A934MWJ2_9GAMM|nr:YecA family protein [Marinomonas transparens]MBJ7538224.1 YecA family protein [Marinomonas transparens]